MNDSESEQFSRSRWQEALEIALKTPERPVQAQTYRQGWKTKAQPVRLSCDDGKSYVVKGRQAGRQIVNDQIVARLGQAMGAPVGEPKIINFPAELINSNRNLSHIPPGTAHGTLWIPDCFDSWELIATSEPFNRLRLSLLAVLYGWVYAGDRQFLFLYDPPRFIYSVDHGHFFPGGPDWTENALREAPDARLDDFFLSECSFTDREIERSLSQLQAVREEEIVRAVASPPVEWGLTIDERVTLVEYLITRQQQLLKQL